MSDPSSMTSSPIAASTPPQDSASALEPLWARIVGGLAGALGFALCVLLFGAPIGIAIAIAAALIAFVRRATVVAMLFAVAAAICAIALAGSTVAVFISSLAFGEALARSARPQPAASAKEQQSGR
jgi:predicted lipid-binding transport protein (Tim44 family)